MIFPFNGPLVFTIKAFLFPEEKTTTKYVSGLPRCCSDKESACQCRTGCNPWVGKIPWGMKWQPTLVFLPGESRGQRSLAGYSPWGRRESDMIEHTCS